MQKTKAGISVGLMGAALYFLGAVNLVPAFLLAAYVLLMEDNEWLKKTAVKMITIIIAFGLMSIGVSLLQSVFGILRSIFGWLPLPFTITVPLNLDSILTYVIAIVKNLILVVCGFKALTMGSMKLGFVDKVVDKNM